MLSRGKRGAMKIFIFIILVVASASANEPWSNSGAEEIGPLKHLIKPLRDSILRERRQADVPEATCEPGKSFKRYCNDCTCGPDGLAKSAVCTRQECAPFMWNEDGTLKQPLSDPIPRERRQAGVPETTCEPGKSFKRYCNDCTCGPDGLVKSAVCTRQECVPFMWNEDGTLKQPLSDPIPRERRQAGVPETTCEPGKSFKSDCNTCYCPESGLRQNAACTQIGCVSFMRYENGSFIYSGPTERRKRQADSLMGPCEPGKSFRHDCNTCICPENGLRISAACTMMACPPAIFNRDTTLVTTEGSSKRKRQAEGDAATCTPGTSFEWYCNTCRCGSDGLRSSAACTRKGCSDRYNQDGSLKDV